MALPLDVRRGRADRVALLRDDLPAAHAEHAVGESGDGSVVRDQNRERGGLPVHLVEDFQNALARLCSPGTRFEEPHDVVKGFFQAVELVLEKPVTLHVLVIGKLDRILDRFGSQVYLMRFLVRPQLQDGKFG